MTIKTKHNAGDEVYFIQQNKVQSAKITQIRVLVYIAGGNPTSTTWDTEITYLVGGYTEPMKELNVYSTKEDLLKSL